MNTSPISLSDELPKVSLTEIFELIDQIAKNLRRIKRQTVSESNLTPPQFAVLNMLWEQDKRPFKEFADALACSRATVTGIIDTLERKELVTRETNPDDRRSLLATLTESGKALQYQIPALDQIYNSCCSGLSPVEYQQLAFLLEKLNGSLIYPEVES